MKKLIILLLCPLLLCGCQQKPQGYLITAITFDYDNGIYTIRYEAVINNTEKENQKREVLTASGNNLLETTKQIENQATLPLIMSHCGVVVIGSGVTPTTLSKIMHYCTENKNIPLSIRFVKSSNTKKLLETDPVSSISVGYDLVGLMENSNNFKNKLFEISQTPFPALPKVRLTDRGYYFE